MHVLGHVSEGEVQTAVQRHIWCITVLPGAHILGVLDGCKGHIPW
jgi:hypothetical protein